jgi:hypothetical protein
MFCNKGLNPFFNGKQIADAPALLPERLIPTAGFLLLPVF